VTFLVLQLRAQAGHGAGPESLERGTAARLPGAVAPARHPDDGDLSRSQEALDDLRLPG
jgi:hypothetical protein